MRKINLYNILSYIILLVVSIITTKPLSDNDMFWHIIVGQEMLTTKSIITIDKFSILGIENNLKWFSHEWLFEIIIAFIYNIWGFIGLFILCVLLTYIILLLLFRTLNLFIPRDKSLCLTVLSSIVLTSFVTIRPQMITYTISIYLLNRLYTNKYTIKTFVLTNLTSLLFHSGALPFVWCLNMFCILNKDKNVKDKKILKEILIANTILFIIILINPFGLGVLQYGYKVTKYDLFYQFITEWFPTKISMRTKTELISIITVFILYKKENLNIFENFLMVVILCLSFTAYRHFVFIPLIALIIAIKSSKENHIFYIQLFTKETHKRITAIIITIFITIYGLNIRSIEPIYTTKNYPSKTLEYIKSHNITRVLNEYGYGGYLMFNRVTPWIDGRADMFTNIYNKYDYFKEFIYMIHKDYNIEEYLKKYNLFYIIIEKGKPITSILKNSNKFEVLSEDEVSILFKYKGE